MVRSVDGGEDPFRKELIRLGSEAPREREIRADEDRKLLLPMSTAKVGFV